MTKVEPTPITFPVFMVLGIGIAMFQIHQQRAYTQNEKFGIGENPVISAGKTITNITWLDKEDLNVAKLNSGR